MLTADLWPRLPADPTWIFVVCLGIVVGYFLLRAYTANQQVQINGLRESLDRQADRHAEEMREMRSRMDKLEAISEQARAERHFLRGEIGKYRMAMSIVADLMVHCSCHALAPLESVIRSLNLEDPIEAHDVPPRRNP